MRTTVRKKTHALSSVTDQRHQQNGHSFWSHPSFVTTVLCHHMGGIYERFRLLNAFILGIAALTTNRDHVILQPNHWLKWQEVGVVLKISPDPVVPNETFAKMSSIN